MTFECNSKTLIGSELDFYFPTLYLAVELNGIFHYKPIHGANKFKQICDSDQQKIIRCRDLGVNLFVVDASSYSHLTVEQKIYYWNVIEPLLANLLQELPSAVTNRD